MERTKSIRIERVDGSVIILTPAVGKPGVFSVAHEDGSEYNFNQRICDEMDARYPNL